MQCNYNSFIQIINFHGLFRNALRCRKTGACRILVPLWYHNKEGDFGQTLNSFRSFNFHLRTFSVSYNMLALLKRTCFFTKVFCKKYEGLKRECEIYLLSQVTPVCKITTLYCTQSFFHGCRSSSLQVIECNLVSNYETCSDFCTGCKKCAIRQLQSVLLRKVPSKVHSYM